MRLKAGFELIPAYTMAQALAPGMPFVCCRFVDFNDLQKTG